MKTENKSKPLYQKLGFKAELIISVWNEPSDYSLLLGCIVGEFSIDQKIRKDSDIIHYFLTTKSELQTELNYLKSNIKQNGMIWISWPKKTSKMKSDLSEDYIRDFAIECGLVDVKVCAVNEIWSGLKLVIPLKQRKL